ncbi:hypothetical protein QYM42_08585 [Lactococcus lactis]|uniref:hypothetical protein n=1 Tax=Lactococcus lactis TaxID=1358 RepID=UPI0026590F36|nr:hypothetical protein [Lactococcus lactis]WKF72434.1 hypothetical protein QYM42_08585 [Lactococcus lactis]
MYKNKIVLTTELENLRRQRKFSRLSLAIKVAKVSESSWKFWGAYQFIKFVEMHYLVLTQQAIIWLAKALECSEEDLVNK